ncbi:MAG: hypothetical protein Ct9H300mP1_18150 [Planctomycetaceae bacterium]|nr:MAG: hypothetical protein Ct9H300mP1_18150 [Planctomycetaceae bacterium]
MEAVQANPVFDNAEVARLVKEGVKALSEMQLSDGGWGWFSGPGESSSAHTTATVVHGLTLARANGAAVAAGVHENGVAWLKRRQAGEVQKLKNAATKTKPYKLRADNLDALVFRVLVEADALDEGMGDFLYRDRIQLSVYAKGLIGLAFHASGQQQRLAMVVRNIDQFLQQDDENQTAWLHLPDSVMWWRWYGNGIEANAIYLKLLALTDPKGVRARGLAKYLVNNRRHATYWNSTRDTALCIESLADFPFSGGGIGSRCHDRCGGRREKGAKSVKVDAENLFSFDNAVVIDGADVAGGKHIIEVRRRGPGGPGYYNTWLSYFTTEDLITRAGLEIKVQRKYYRLVQRKDATADVPGGRGQALKQARLVYDRQPLAHLGELTSGDLVEIELEIESKNDYEYLVSRIQRRLVSSRWIARAVTRGGTRRCTALRDDRVAFFFRTLGRGRHSFVPGAGRDPRPFQRVADSGSAM